MARRWRVRRVAKWAGSCTSIALLGVILVNLRWSFSFWFNDAGVDVGRGAIWPYRIEGSDYDNKLHFEVIRETDFAKVMEDWRRGGLWFTPTSGDWPTIPLWMPLGTAAGATVVLWLFDRRRVVPGHCGRCGYDLTGNVSGRCPECGEAVAVQKAAVGAVGGKG